MFYHYSKTKYDSIRSALDLYKTLISWLYEKELDLLEYDIILEYIDKQLIHYFLLVEQSFIIFERLQLSNS